MKKGVLALTLVLTACLARAVTQGWTEVELSSYGGIRYKDYFNRSIDGGEGTFGGGSFSAKIVLSGAAFGTVSDSGSGTLVQLIQSRGGATLNASISYDGSKGKWVAKDNIGHTTKEYALSDVIKDNSVELLLTYDDAMNELVFYLAGMEVERITVELTGKDFNLNVGGLSGPSNLLTGVFTGGAWGASVEVLPDVVLPEPTAFAFLALGVAGLMLRRRVA